MNRVEKDVAEQVAEAEKKAEVDSLHPGLSKQNTVGKTLRDAIIEAKRLKALQEADDRENRANDSV